MNILTHNIIGWSVGLAIGFTIGGNNIALSLGLGVAFGAGLSETQKKENTPSE